jgi:hypothetical protein
MKISRKYYSVLFGTLMALGMVFAVSLVITLINVGFSSGFWITYLQTFMIGFLVSLPTSIILVPVVKRMVDKLTAE